ncbi:uncharacterized protein PV09_06002 [Verruconis gallopava]|uniref:1,3-beta-glucanosyltransferase n=1 Tax=Verruconis gallopava TaxID=253628 RepID=A0A0D1XJS0_9PEZI|nr:uncharacterized protein PV09_06002 [Verruconis gallopava]KIW02546.1 hypothetical protein PV09_06002 [Verruconis gallopava]
MRLSTLVTACAGVGLAHAALPQLHIKGSKFFDANGNQFYIKGVAYQLQPEDPLIDTAQCQRDASLMKELGANTIRVYHVDPNGDHDGCMSAFEDAGIYVFLDLDTFDTQIEQLDPHWNQTQLDAFSKVLDAFHGYDNLAGVFVGNEVLTTGEGSAAAPYVKAAARDIKAYRDSKNYRAIPVGYSAADIASLRPMLQNYLACGSNASETIDYYALNAYEWCGDSSYTVSGYSQLTQNVTDYDIPIFFSETGCNTVPPRTFTDQAAIFGSEMNPYWSGAIIYEWIEEQNNYGLVSYGPRTDPTASGAPPDGFTRSGTPLPVTPDFQNLQNQWKTLTPTGVKESDYSPSLTPPPCPSYTSGVWEVNGNVPPPSVGQILDRSSITAGFTTTSASASTTTSRGSGNPEREIKAGAVGLGLALAGAVAWL